MEMKGAGLNPGNQKPCERKPRNKAGIHRTSIYKRVLSGNKEVTE